jgi:hypothetical protein
VIVRKGTVAFALALASAASVLGVACSSSTFHVAPEPAADAGDASVESGAVTDADTASDTLLSPDVRPTGVYADLVIADKPLGYWRLNDPIGAPSAADSSSGGHPGTCLGKVSYGVEGALATDPSSTGVDLQTGTISMGDHFGFTGTAPFTFEVWIRPAFADDMFRRIIAKEVAPPAVREGVVLDLVRPNALAPNQAKVGFSRFVGGAEDRVTGIISLTETTYHHVVVTYDGSVLKLWIDGLPRDSLTTTGILKSTTTPFALGGEQAGSIYEGHLDEVAVYDHALTANRILAHWAHRRP